MTSSRILAAAVAAGLSFVALSAHADEDRFTLRLGAMQAHADASFKGAVDFDGQDYHYESDRMDFGDKVIPRVEGAFHFTDRNRILFNYFRYDESRKYTLGEDVTFGDTTFPAGSDARAKTKFDVASAVYDFSPVETDTFSFGLQLGAEWLNLEGRAQAESGSDSFSGSDRVHGWAPVVGARLATNTSDQKWRFALQAQYLDASWGKVDGRDLAGDYSGSISRANAIAEYRFTRNFGLYAGYDWFKLDVNKDLGGGARAGIDTRFKGPIAGVTLAF